VEEPTGSTVQNSGQPAFKKSPCTGKSTALYNVHNKQTALPCTASQCALKVGKHPAALHRGLRHPMG
jgi:hypothetical protein